MSDEAQVLDIEAEAREPLRNTRWEKFAQVRAVEGLTRSQAYRAIGGKGDPVHQGKKIDQQPLVAARIRFLQLQMLDRRQSTSLYDERFLFRTLLENIEDARSAYVVSNGKVVYMTDHEGQVVKDDDGDPIPLRKVNGTVVNNAVELLGRPLGTFPQETRLRTGEIDEWAGKSIREILETVRNRVLQDTDGMVDFDVDALEENFLRALEQAEQGAGK